LSIDIGLEDGGDISVELLEEVTVSGDNVEKVVAHLLVVGKIEESSSLL
jgi:hypothetical protein